MRVQRGSIPWLRWKPRRVVGLTVLGTCLTPFLLQFLLQGTTTDLAIDDVIVEDERSNPEWIPSPEVVVVPDVRVRGADCAALFRNDPEVISRAQSMGTRSQDLLVNEHTQDLYGALTQNCSYFRWKRQYMSRAASQAEQDFPLAYSILTYDNPRQTERLLRAIYRPQNYYCIHVDRKAPRQVHTTMKSVASCFDNVILASHSVGVRWGTFSVLLADLTCMNDLLMTFKHWKYFINLTGKEFPLRTNAELIAILRTYNNANEVNAKIKNQTAADRRRFRFRHDPKSGVRRPLLKGPPPFNLTLVKGSVHVTLSRAFVNFTLSDPKARKFQHWITDGFIPDEIFFSTINYNPRVFEAPGSFTGSDPDTDPHTKPFLSRYKEWQEMGIACHGKFRRNICIFGVGDLARLQIQPHFFLNKLYDDFQPLTFDCLEEWYFNRTRMDYLGQKHFDLSFYERQSLVRSHMQ